MPVTSGTTAAYNVTNLRAGQRRRRPVAAGKHLYAVHAADASVPAGEVYDLGVVTTGQTVKVALP